MYLTFYGMWVRSIGATNHGIQEFYGLNEGLCLGSGPEKVISTFGKLLPRKSPVEI